MPEAPREPVGVSPRVDCVFKAILGAPERVHVLLDFLHAVLQPARPFVELKIVNPVHLPDFVGDDFTALDVEAVDADGRVFQVEMQTRSEAALRLRMLYTWADLFDRQLVAGEDYQELRPVLSIWLLDTNLFSASPAFHHRFRACDPDHGVELTQHMEIHTLELPKWRRHQGETALDLARWMSFFAEGETWTEVPGTLSSPPLEEAMQVLQQFQANAQWSSLYRMRLDGLRRKRTLERAMERERERAEAEHERAESERARAEAERSRAETERERAEAERVRADAARAERKRAEADRERAEADRERAEAERLRAEEDRERAEAERLRADEDRERAEAERKRADEDRERAEAERKRALDAAERMRARLIALGIDPDAP